MFFGLTNHMNMFTVHMIKMFLLQSRTDQKGQPAREQNIVETTSTKSLVEAHKHLNHT